MTFFHLKSTILARFFTVDGSDRTDRVFGAKPTAPIRLLCRSAAGQNFLSPILSSRSQVGHKPNPDRPMDTPNFGIACVKVWLLFKDIWLNSWSILFFLQFICRKQHKSYEHNFTIPFLCSTLCFTNSNLICFHLAFLIK